MDEERAKESITKLGTPILTAEQEAFWEKHLENATTKQMSSKQIKKQIPVAEIVKQVLVSAALVAAVGLFIYLKLTDKGQVRTIFGYSIMTIMSGSMESRIPQDSLVFVKKILPEDIIVGDDIAFHSGDGMIITHRVIEISGKGIKTKGTNNPNPDAKLVAGENVVGRVVLCIPKIGKFVYIIGKNAALSLFLGVLVIAFIFGLRFFRQQTET